MKVILLIFTIGLIIVITAIYDESQKSMNFNFKIEDNKNSFLDSNFNNSSNNNNINERQIDLSTRSIELEYTPTTVKTNPPILKKETKQIISKQKKEKNNLQQSIELFVSLKGSINASGSINNPFMTLENARDAARKLKKNSVNIWIREGTYYLNKTFVLNSNDSRNKNAPLKISAFRNEKVTLVGGISVTDWNKVTDENILSQLPEEARVNVLVANLKKLGITKYGSPIGGGLELFFNEKPTILSRWPNSGFMKIKGLVEPGSMRIRQYFGSKTGKIIYDGSRPSRWIKEKEIWLDGYWFWDWSDEKQLVSNINTSRKTIELSKPYHKYGYRKNQYFYAYNLLSEIDFPNEWYLDRKKGLLYFLPEGDIKYGNAQISTLESIINIIDASYIIVDGISLSVSRNFLAKIENGSNNKFINCKFSNSNKHGIYILRSPNSQIKSSELYNIGSSAIIIRGGDRKFLVSSNICAINNHIHHYGINKKTYTSAVIIEGVGNCIKNNHIHDAPHTAIQLYGNNHIIEYNDIHDVVLASNDAGAIYAGRDWTSRGNIIRFNYLHDINGFKNKGAAGIYLDDEFSSAYIYGNIFDNVPLSVLIGGGKDNIVENNLFVNSPHSIHLDNRGQNWAANILLSQLMKKLEAVPYKSHIWVQSYPELKNILESNLRAPTGNIVRNNVFFNQDWNDISYLSNKYITLKNNHVLVNQRPTLKYDLPQFVNGFKKIPFDDIGIK